MRISSTLGAAVTAVLLSMTMLIPPQVAAHCDTLNGPVIKEAKLALTTGDITPVLKWVKPEHESEIRNVFARTLKVRNQGPDAQDLADSYFFETLVRIHRAGEGAPYTGLKSEPVEAPIAKTDEALESGSVEPLLKMMAAEVSEGIQQRFARATEAKKHAGESVVAGREYVAAYVELTHYIEGLHQVATGGQETGSNSRHAH